MVITEENIDGWVAAYLQGFIQGLDVLKIFGYLVKSGKIKNCNDSMKYKADTFISRSLLSLEGVVNTKKFKELVSRGEMKGLTKKDIEQHMADLLPMIVTEVMLNSDRDNLGLPAMVKLIEAKIEQSEERFVKMFEQKKC